MIILLFIAFMVFAAGLSLLVFLLLNSPISRTIARPGLSYTVESVHHTIPDLEFGRQTIYLIRPQVLSDMLHLLQYTHQLLTRHNITYWLTIGNLLGLVRHHGFTPWDDDIDMHIPLAEMHRLLALESQIRADGYRLMRAEGGLKLAYSNRYRFPYVDLVFVEKEEGFFKLCFPLDHYGRPTFAKARQWPKECLPVEDVMPLQLVSFENSEVWAPAHPERLVRHIYGEKAIQEVRHRKWARLVNHFTMMTLYRLGFSKG